jgi:hypothetical protein
MGTYETRGGTAASPDFNDPGIHPLVESVLVLLEGAEIPTEVNDKIVTLIEGHLRQQSSGE